MDAYTTAKLLSGHDWSRVKYKEFLRRDSMSLGLYMLPKGGIDSQKPHEEDEVYYVVSGRGQMTVGDEEQAVQPGSIVFVAATVPHRFHSITEDLTLLVFFAPAESSGKPQTQAKG